VIARAAALCLALATGAGGFAVAQRIPEATGTARAGIAPAGTVRLAIPAATATLTCPGAETSIVPDGGVRAPSPGPFALTAAAAGPDAAHVALAPLTGGRPVAALGGTGSGPRVLRRDGAPVAPLRLRAAPTGADPTRLSAVQTTLARAGDLRALVTGSCAEDASDAWLVGGGTAPGRRGRLLLANPTPAPALVDVLLAGPSGPVEAPAGRGIVVAPGRVRAVQLDALAPGLARLAVHVVARRGRVAAVLHDSHLRGATPAGADDVAVAAPASRHLVVPGLVVPAVPPGGRASATVRLVAPGGEDAVVHLHLSGPAGHVQLPGGGVVTVPAGGVLDVPLPALAPGAYAALADADDLIVAGAVVGATGPASGPLGTAPTDVGWAAATAPLMGDVVFALPRPTDSRSAVVSRAPSAQQLVLTTVTDPADVLVRQVGADGRPVRQGVVRVPALRTVGVALGPDAVALELSVPDGRRVWGGVFVQVVDPAGPLLSLLSLAPPVAAAQDAPPAVADPWLTGPYEPAEPGRSAGPAGAGTGQSSSVP
jgi:hypothetical protein